MKTPDMIATEQVISREEQLDALLREKQKAELEKAYHRMEVLKALGYSEWTFATKKLKNGSCFLLAKKKYSYDKYRFICVGDTPARFKTKTSAHNAAEDINSNGIDNTRYTLGKEYTE